MRIPKGPKALDLSGGSSSLAKRKVTDVAKPARGNLDGDERRASANFGGGADMPVEKEPVKTAINDEW